LGLPLEVTPVFGQTWWFRTTSTLLFTAGIVGLVRFVSFRRLKRKLQHLEREEALHHERARIARDMHDEVGSKLSRLSLLSEMASHDAAMPPAPRREVAEISETARETIRSLEEIVWAVNPKNDMLANLMHYLCRFAEDFFEGSTTVCVFDIPSEIPQVELPTDLRHHVFLAAKEALNNVYKHAAASRVSVSLRLIANGFEIEIEDDGRGFTETAPSANARSGNGLGNMRERMRQAGGECEIQSQPGVGTRVTLRGRCPRVERR
jgi:signal transduction histidine kinase